MSGRYVDNVGGISTTTTTGDYNNLAAWGEADRWSTLETGRYAYKAVTFPLDFTSPYDEGYETGVGWWDGSTLRRDTIKTSSNSGNTVDWTGERILLVLVADAEMLQRGNIDPFPYKGKNDPIVIFGTGQSNIFPTYTSRVAMVNHPNVYFYNTDGIRLAGTGTVSGGSWVAPPAQDPAKLAFRKIDVNADSYIIGPDDIPTTIGDFGNGSGATFPVYTGHTLGGVGLTTWGCAVEVAKNDPYGRPVYVINIARIGQAIAEWADGAAIRTEIEARLDAAFAEIQLTYPNVDKIDIAIWQQGGADGDAGTPPVEYSESWKNFMDWLDTNYGSTQVTRRYFCDYPITWPNYGWLGGRYAVAMDEGRTVMISSANKEVLGSGDNVHFWGDSANLFGEEIARSVFFGPQPTMPAIPQSFIPNDAYAAITATTFEYEGLVVPPARPSTTEFTKGYFGGEAFFDSLSITDSAAFQSPVDFGSIEAGDTITVTQNSDTDRWARITVDVAGVYSSTGSNALDTGFWFFETTLDTSGPSGIPNTGELCTLTTTGQTLLEFTDLLNSNTGGKIGIGYAQGDLLPNAQLAVKLDDEVNMGFHFESSGGNTFRSFIDDSFNAISFTADLDLTFQTGGDKLVFSVVDPDTGSFDVGIEIRTRGDRDPYARIGGVGLDGLTQKDPPDDAQAMIGPQETLTTNDNQGLCMWSPTANTEGRYGWASPSTPETWVAGVRYTHSNDRVSVINESGTSSNEMHVTVDADWIGLAIDDTQADSATWGLYVSPTKGNGVTLSATVAGTPTGALMPLILKGNVVRFPILAGTGVRTVRADADGDIEFDDAEHYTITHQSTNGTPAFVSTTITQSNGDRKRYKIIATANRQTTAGTFYREDYFTAHTDSGTLTRSTTRSPFAAATTGTGSSLALTYGTATNTIVLIATGNASETWDWDFQVEEEDIT